MNRKENRRMGICVCVYVGVGVCVCVFVSVCETDVRNFFT